MNRTSNLLESIQTWNNQDLINEIIVLDWSSDQPILYSDLPKGKNGKEIKLIRVENQPRWILSHAFNLAISFVEYDHLLKLDADILLKPNFLDCHKLKESCFYRGNWKIARNENELHLNGQLHCKTEDFWNVNGYHEGITTYGWDDSDIYNRLESSGLNALDFDYDYFNHIASSNKERHKHQDIVDLSDLLEPDISNLTEQEKLEALEIAKQLKSMRGPDSGESTRLFFETQKNRIWSQFHPWSAESPRRSWDIIKQSNNLYICN